MNDIDKVYWAEMHKKYSARGLGVKPTKFACEVLEYLPTSGALLDLGAGQGQDSRFFAEHGYVVTSTDLTPEPLAISRRLAEESDLSIDFAEVDVSKLFPFADKRFDVVYSHLALHYLNEEKTRQLFAEIHRVLKSNGVFATLLNTVEDGETNNTSFVEIEPDFYKTPGGIYKRYFSVDTLADFTKNFFEPTVLDAKGKTYKDDIETLIRFVGVRK